MPVLNIQDRLAARWPDVIDKKHRLKNSSDFRSIRNSGKVFKHPLVIIITSPNSVSTTRIGIVAGKSTGGAVQRNLIKRRLRACMREQLSMLGNGWDIIVIARPQSGKVGFPDLQSAVSDLLHKAGLFCPADRQT